MSKKGERWIQAAVSRPGDLTAKAKRAKALTKQGTIKVAWLRAKAKGSDRTARQARLALTLRKLGK